MPSAIEHDRQAHRWRGVIRGTTVMPGPYHHGHPMNGLVVTPGEVLIWTLPGFWHCVVVGVGLVHSEAAAAVVEEWIATIAAM